jgi:hypothetical protein
MFTLEDVWASAKFVCEVNTMEPCDNGALLQWSFDVMELCSNGMLLQSLFIAKTMKMC